MVRTSLYVLTWVYKQNKSQRNNVKAWIVKNLESVFCPLLTAWTHLIALLDQGQCSAPCKIKFFTKSLTIAPCKKSRTSQKLDSSFDCSSFMHWTYNLLKKWHGNDQLHQETPRRHSRSTWCFHADMVVSCTSLSAVLKFIFLKHLLQLSSAFACTRVFCTKCLPVPYMFSSHSFCG